MKITVKTDYALRAVFELAIRGKGGISSIQEIAQNQRIPKRYLEHLLLMLKKEKIVDSTRGKKGGYVLAKKPENITILDIIRSVEGQIELIPDIQKYGKGDLVSEVWRSVQVSVEKLLNSITVVNLINKKAATEKVLNYYI